MTGLAAHRPLIRLGMSLLLGAVAAGIWELLASQSPGTPLFIGMLSGPIGALRELCTTLGLLMLITSLLLAGSQQVPPPALVWLLHVGTLTSVGSQLYGALYGMPGVQVVDFRPGVRPLFMTKHAALGLVVVGLIDVGRRVLWPPKTREVRLSRRPASPPVQLDSEEQRH